MEALINTIASQYGALSSLGLLTIGWLLRELLKSKQSCMDLQQANAAGREKLHETRTAEAILLVTAGREGAAANALLANTMGERNRLVESLTQVTAQLVKDIDGIEASLQKIEARLEDLQRRPACGGDLQGRPR